LKILYHHRTRASDGQNVHIEELVSALRRLGHEVIVVGPAVAGANTPDTESYYSRLKKHLPGAIYEILELAYALIVYRRLKRAYLLHRPDCIYERYNLFQPAGIWLKRKYKIPLILEVNSPLVHERNEYGGLALKGLAKATENMAWRGADYVLPVTNVLADHIRAAGVPDSRIKVIPNGINTERFSNPLDSDKAKERLGLRDKLVLGFTGHIRSWHGLDQVIPLLAEKGKKFNLHFLVVGDGPARAELEALAKINRVSERITISGIIPREEIANHIAAFDVALQPAVTPYASPLKLFEYMALGRAIVAPATPNIREILTNGQDALLFDPNSPNDFRTAIEKICDNKELRHHLETAARETLYARELTWDNNARRVEKLFLGLLDTATVQSS